MRIAWMFNQFIRDFFATEEMLYGDWYDKKGNLSAHIEKDKITLKSIKNPLKWELVKKGRCIRIWSDGFDYNIIDFSIRKEKLFLYFRETGEATALFKRSKRNEI